MPGGLTAAMHQFCLRYLENGFNAAEAYRHAHQDVTQGTSEVGGHRMLRNAKVSEFLKDKLEEAWKPYQMGGEQALGRLALVATFDIRTLYDAKTKTLKPIDSWPDEIIGIVRKVNLEKGEVAVESGLAALRMILEQQGKLKSVGGGIDALAEAIKADQTKYAGATT